MLGKILQDLAFSILGVFGSVWWIIAIIIIIYVLLDWHLVSARLDYVRKQKWILLEINFPKENLRSPKSMEQVFSALYATYSFGFVMMDKWVEGKVEEWMTAEMVGFSQGVHFYIRCNEKSRKLVETALFSHYPEVEIDEAEDYVDRFGSNLPNSQYELFGTDFVLNKGNAHPIKTYEFFEDNVEEKRVDPISTITEVMSNLKDDEMAWIQILFRPTGNKEINEEAETIINKIAGRETKKSSSNLISWFFTEIFDFVKNLIVAPVTAPVWPGGEIKKDSATAAQKRSTPGEINVLKGVENKISKLCFECILRFIYIDSRTSFTGQNITAIFGGLRDQFTTQNMNSFRPNMKTMTIPAFSFPFINKKARLLQRKKTIFFNYVNRYFPIGVKPMILNTEELATIFHPPMTQVGAPKLWRLESKKGEPPSNLPINE